MAQQVGVLAALEWNLGSVPSSSKSAVTPGPGDPVHFLTSIGTRLPCGTLTYTQAKHPYTSNKT